jgi:hypothetical protein
MPCLQKDYPCSEILYSKDNRKKYLKDYQARKLKKKLPRLSGDLRGRHHRLRRFCERRYDETSSTRAARPDGRRYR